MAKILIGIPTCRRPRPLERLLRTLEAQEGIDEHTVEVFVGDNDPEQGDGAKVCAAFRAQYRWPLNTQTVEEPGISAVRNRILAEAFERRADFVAMLDDDEWVISGWLREMLRVQQMTGAAIVGGPVLSEFERPLPRDLERCGIFTRRRASTGPTSLIDGTGNVLLSCLALDRVGRPLFDASFGLTGGGDKEFFLRLRRLGLKFAWADEALASETVPPSRACTNWVLRRAFRLGNAHMRIQRLHGDKRGMAIDVLKIAAALGTAPVFALALLSDRRLLVLRKWVHTAGKIAAMMGYKYEEYRKQRKAELR